MTNSLSARFSRSEVTDLFLTIWPQTCGTVLNKYVPFNSLKATYIFLCFALAIWPYGECFLSTTISPVTSVLTGNLSASSVNTFVHYVNLAYKYPNYHMSPVKRICVFEHSVMTNFNCACPAVQRGQGSGFLSEGSSWLTACMSEQRRFWRDCADAQARLNLRCSHRR